MELRQANKEGTGIKKHGRGGSMACPILFRRYLILLKSPVRVWEAHVISMEQDSPSDADFKLDRRLCSQRRCRETSCRDVPEICENYAKIIETLSFVNLLCSKISVYISGLVAPFEILEKVANRCKLTFN